MATDLGDLEDDPTRDPLAARLAALEARAPAGEPPALRHRARITPPLALAAALTLVLAATAAGGTVILGGLVGAAPGVENPGQPLHGANLECMTPPEAAAYLATHGYADVVWQVETGSEADGKGGTSVQQAIPPEHGYVVPGAVLSDGRLHMVVDQRVGASGVGPCHDMAMP